MILDKKILIGLSPRNVSYYEQKGYEIPRKKEESSSLLDVFSN